MRYIRTLLLTFFFRHMTELIKREQMEVGAAASLSREARQIDFATSATKTTTKPDVARDRRPRREAERRRGRCRRGVDEVLLNVQEYDLAAGKMARELREPRLVDLLAAGDLEKKTDFEERRKPLQLSKAIDKAKLDLDAKIVYDEEHSLYDLVTWHRGASRRQENQLGVCVNLEFKVAGGARQVRRELTVSFTVSAQRLAKD